MSGEYDFKRSSAQIETLLDKISEVGNKGKTYYLTTRGLLDNSDKDTFSLDSADLFTLESMRRTNNLLVDSSIFYTGRDSSGNQYIVPLNFYFDTENEPFYASVSYTDPNNGKSYTFKIHSNDDGSDYWASKVTEVSGGGGSGGENIEYTGGKMGGLVGTSATYTASDCEIGKWYIFSVDLRFYATNSDYWLTDNIALKLGSTQIRKAAPSNSGAEIGHAYFEISSIGKDITVTIRSSIDATSDFSNAYWVKVSLIKM